MKIGFIGLGAMGGRLAARLTGVGELTVFDTSQRAMKPFSGRASLRARRRREAGTDADVVGVCVRTNTVGDCVDALLPVMKRGSVLMIHSTVSPDTVKAAAKRAEPYAITVIDAPVTVTRYDGADAPFVCMMVGGADAADERTKPLLEACATDVVQVGPLGSAMSLKIINNLVSLVQIIVAEEAFRLAALSGVPAEALEAVMKGNGALTPTMMAIASRAALPPEDEPRPRCGPSRRANGREGSRASREPRQMRRYGQCDRDIRQGPVLVRLHCEPAEPLTRAFWSTGRPRGESRPGREDRGQLRVEERLLDRVGGERAGGVVGRRGFLVSAEAAQQVGPRRVEQVVAVEAAA